MLVFVLVCITLSPFWFTLENHRTPTAQSMIVWWLQSMSVQNSGPSCYKRVIFWSIFYF